MTIDFTNLDSIFGTYDPLNLLSKEIANDESDVALVKSIQELLTKISPAKKTSELIAKIKQLDQDGADKIKKYLHFFTTSDGSIAIDPNPEGKQTSIFLSKSPYLSNTLRQSAEVETFLNGMPSVIMSQCAPYVSLEFVFERASNGEKLNTPSLYKFLYGGKSNAQLNAFDQSVIAATSKKIVLTQENSDTLIRTYAGMELFTSPQTLLNLDKAEVNASRFNPV